jgi:hypothetical protein
VDGLTQSQQFVISVTEDEVWAILHAMKEAIYHGFE